MLIPKTATKEKETIIDLKRKVNRSQKLSIVSEMYNNKVFMYIININYLEIVNITCNILII